ncbi:MAG: hypothetical protein V2J65_19635, partial [Desulfobacteraceae bacterium]|nr:hypothetical protein [Desulfobacteraceae bacterium]
MLKPDPPPAEDLNTAGKRDHSYDPFGVDQGRDLWTRTFRQVHIAMCAPVWSVRVDQQANELKFL